MEGCNDSFAAVFFATSSMVAVVATIGFAVVPFLRAEMQYAKKRKVPVSRSGDAWSFIEYRIDYYFSTYPASKPLVLLYVTLVLIVFGATLQTLLDYMTKPAVSVGFLANLWSSWTFVADPGTHTEQQGIVDRFVAFVLTVGGMLVFALVISIVADFLDTYVDTLKKGRSKICECGHTVVVGWGDKLLPVINQLAMANESESGDVIVVMADLEKEEMEEEMLQHDDLELRGSTLVFRKGCPVLMNDLRKVSAHTARSVIVLADKTLTPDETDAFAVRVVLCLAGLSISGHAVVEVTDVDNEAFVNMVGGHFVETIVTHDMIGRLMLQCARQRGLSQVLEGLMGFDGDEFYTAEWEDLVGATFGEVLFRFDQAVPFGVKRAGSGVGEALINPDNDVVLQPGDQVLVLAEDDDSYGITPMPVLGADSQRLPEWTDDDMELPESFLFVGWRRDIDDIIIELDKYVQKDSSLTLYCEVPIEEREAKLADGGLTLTDLQNLQLKHIEGSSVLRRDLAKLPLEQYDSVLIFADESLEASMMNADSRSLACLLLVRDIQAHRVRHLPKRVRPQMVISEMLDTRTRTLVKVAGVSDYVLSNELVSMAIAQVAEDREINGVLRELLSEDGNEIYIKNIQCYATPGTSLSFWDVMALGRLRREVVIGYVRGASEETVLNPKDKSLKIDWELEDRIVVIAED